jgi:hypothetical protein
MDDEEAWVDVSGVQIYKKRDNKWVKTTHATDILFSIEEAEKPETLNQRVNRLESQVRTMRARLDQYDAGIAGFREEWKKKVQPIIERWGNE